MKIFGQIDTIQDFLLSVGGIFAGIGLILFILLVFQSQKVRWGLLALLLFVSSMGEFDNKWRTLSLAFPLEQIRAGSRVICIFVFGLLLLSAAYSRIKTSFPMVVSRSALFLIFLEFYMSFRDYMEGGDLKPILSMVIYVMIYLLFICVVPNWGDGEKMKQIEILAISSTFFVVATLYQLRAKASAVIWDGRLTGTTGNAQHAAVLIATALMFHFYLITNINTPKNKRIFWCILSVILFGMLLWTGSRTGMLMLLVGSAIFFRKRRKLIVLLAAIATISLVAFFVINPDASSSAGRLTDTTNDREMTWESLLSLFYRSPLIGGTTGERIVGESSYLCVLGGYGIVGAAIMAIFLALLGMDLYRFLRNVQLEDTSLKLLIFSGVLALLFGALLEGYLVGTISYPLFALYLYIGMMTNIQNKWSQSEPFAN
jgi:hypothetical protein